jgi:alpha-ketoglutaric semialdehyde dehydrogenase
VEAAKAAYEMWRLVPAPKRGEILYRFANLLIEEKDDLTDLMSREMGKVKAEAGGDVQEAIDMSLYMAGEGRRLFGQTTPSELPDKFNMSVRQPIGVVGAITPWNFPIAIPSWKIAPAIVCGNTVVFKPATDTPALGERFVELFAEAGLPAGVLNIVHGGGGAVGDRLVKHPDVRVITLTGSRETGVEVMRNAADGLKHVHLELGGKNAIIVLDDADLELAVDGIIWSAFGTSGQRCTAASRVIVQEGVYDALQSKLVAAAEKMRLGPGWEDDTDVGPVINQRALEKIDSYTKIGKDEGAKLLTGGEVANDNGLDKGFFYRPTIFGDVDPQMRVAQEEIFGPTTALIRVRDVDEAIRVSNGIKYGLSSSIFTRDVNKAFRAMRDLEAGITYINAGTIGAEVHLPFGGMKDTGNGHREAGQAALDVFTEWKSIYVDYSGKLQKAQIDNSN